MVTILDTVIHLQQSGMSNEQITATLLSQGTSPKEINQAINQAQIKNAIIQSEQLQSPEIQIPTPNPEDNFQQEQYQQAQSSNYYNQPQQNNFQQEQQYQQEQYQQAQYPNYYNQPQQEYQNDYYQQPTYDTETITEIAEQVISEKFKDFNEKNGDIATFKNSTQDKVNDIDSRLKRIESTIDKLQQAIIQKIGEFGENTSMIKRDIANLHDVTSKLMNPLIDNYRELQKRK